MNPNKMSSNKCKGRKGVPNRDEQTSTSTLEYPPILDGVSFSDDVTGIPEIQVPVEFDQSFATSFEQEALGDDEEFSNELVKPEEEPLKIINGLESAEIDQEILDNLYLIEDAEHLHNDKCSGKGMSRKDQPKGLPDLDLSPFNSDQQVLLKQFVDQFNEATIRYARSSAHPLHLAFESRQANQSGNYLVTKRGPITVPQPKTLTPSTVVNIVQSQTGNNSSENSMSFRKKIIDDLTKGYVWNHRIRSTTTKVINIKTPGYTPVDIDNIICQVKGITNGKEYMEYVLIRQNKLKLLKSQYLLRP